MNPSEAGPTIAHLQKVTGIAGSEGFLLQLGERLTARGWDCHFGMLHPPEHQVARFALERAGWSVHPIPIKGRFSLSAVRSIRHWLRELRPSLIHTHLIHADLHGLLGSLGLNLKRVTTKHNDDWFKRVPGYGPFARLLNRGFDRGVVISDHLMDVYRDRLSVTSPPLRRIHYGLDPDTFFDRAADRPDESSSSDSPDLPRDPDFCFGMVARMVEQKGHRHLVKAFKRVRERLGKGHLVLVGAGPLRQDIDDWIQEEGIEEAVTLTGFRWDVPSLLGRFDAFVHPSLWEGFGRVFLEAMAARLPVVATEVGAIPEIVVDGETGLLCPPEDPGSLTEAMVSLARRPERAQRMGEKGFQRLREHFSVEAMIDRHESLYRELLTDEGST